MRQFPPSRLDDGYPILTGAFCRSGPKLFPEAALCQEPEEESGLESHSAPGSLRIGFGVFDHVRGLETG